MGTIYLLCFIDEQGRHTPYWHAGHYILPRTSSSASPGTARATGPGSSRSSRRPASALSSPGPGPATATWSAGSRTTRRAHACVPSAGEDLRRRPRAGLARGPRLAVV